MSGSSERRDYTSAALKRSPDAQWISTQSDGLPRKALPRPPSSNSSNLEPDQVTYDINAKPLVGRIDMDEDETQVDAKGVSHYKSNEGSNPSGDFQNNQEKEQIQSTAIPPKAVSEAELNVAKVSAFEAEQQLAESRLECDKLRWRVQELTGLLQDAQDVIFRLQPYRQKITEAEAVAHYASLCQSVESWIGFRLGDDIYERTILKDRAFETGTAMDVLRLVPAAGRECFGYADTDEPNLVAAVMQFLTDELFARDFYCPLEPGSMDFLSSVEKSMRTLTPQRDTATIRSWRSETLNAVVNRHSFEAQRGSRAKQLTTALARMLRIFRPRTDLKEFQASVKSSIIDPAIELVHMLHLSVDQFELKWTPYAEGRATERERPSSILDLQQFDCVNLLGKAVKFPVEQGGASRQASTIYLLDICPGLYCRSVKSNGFSEPKVLKKPKVLVDMAKSDGQPLSRKPADAGATLLGMIERHCTRGAGRLN